LAESTGQRETPTFGVVVVNFNRPADTLDCLESLHQTDPRPRYVVVVDNGSSDDTVAQISDWARSRGISLQKLDAETERAVDSGAWLTVIRSERNRGFSGGNNVGVDYLLRHTDATHWLLLNNDATVKEDFFAHIAAVIRSTPAAGLMTGTIYHDPARDRVWYAGGKEMPYRALVAHMHEVPADGLPRQTEFITGCAMVVSREAHSRIGSLAEVYFPGYSEDAEYSRRVRNAGMDLIYAPRAIAWHKVGATAGPAAQSPSILRAQMRHRVYYARRNFRGPERAIALSYLAITKPAKAVMEVLKGRPRLAWAVMRGTIEGFTDRV